jgi:hypothetical protein
MVSTVAGGILGEPVGIPKISGNMAIQFVEI